MMVVAAVRLKTGIGLCQIGLLGLFPINFRRFSQVAAAKKKGVGLYDVIEGIGADEIIIEGPEHSLETQFLSPRHFFSVLQIMKGRMCDLEKDKRFEYLSLYMNKGEASGASLEHSHWQLNAYPIKPPEITRELDCCKIHYEKRGRCLICDIFYQELESGTRIVEANEVFVVLSPFAPRFAAELFISPSPEFHKHSFLESDDYILEALASIFQKTLMRLARVFNNPPYNICLHTTPFFRRQTNSHGATIKDDYHWHFHITPRIDKIAAQEISNDIFINTMLPEEVARLLREVKV